MGITDKSRQQSIQRKLDKYKSIKAPDATKSKVTDSDVKYAYDKWQAARELYEETGEREHWLNMEKASKDWDTLNRKLAKGE